MKKYTIGLQDDFGQWLCNKDINAMSIDNALNAVGKHFNIGHSNYVVAINNSTNETLSIKGSMYNGQKTYIDNR